MKLLSVRVLAWALSAQCALFSGRALAEPHGDVNAAEQRFTEGLSLMDAGRYAEACPKLEESQALAPASGTLLNLADCYEHVGQLASAWRTFLQAAELAHGAGKSDREQIARQRGEALAGRLARLSVSAPRTEVPGLSIAVDGIELPRAYWGVAMAVDPGAHVVSAKAPGRQPFQTSLAKVSAGDTIAVGIPTLDAVAPAPSAVAYPEPGRRSIDGQKVGALVSAGVGVIALGVGTGFALHSSSKHDQSERYCQGSACTDQRGVDALAAARAAGNRSTVAFVIGGVGLGAAAVLWFVRPFGESSSAELAVGPGTLAIHGKF